MPDKAPVVWDKATVKWLLKAPMKLQRHPAYWQWILERGGVKEVQRSLRALPLSPDAARLLQAILDDPRQPIAIYAARLNVSEPTYFRWFHDLVTRLVVELNQHQQATLPLPTSLFIGRDAEVALVRQLLLQPSVRLVTLTGPGGIGKTCLSIQAVRTLGDAFADGIVFVPLAAIRNPELVSSVLIQALGLQRAGTVPELELLISYLRRRELLLVVDNFEQLLPAATLLNALLERTPGLKILVTSRSVLRLRGEQTVFVPPLSLPEPLPASAEDQPLATLAQAEAVRLFVDRAQMLRSDFRLTSANAWAVAEICRRLDGVPLAIELAAARIRVLSPQAMVARLDQSLALLVRGPVDLPAHQQTMRQTLDWSYDLLSPAAQGLFRQLAVFAGGCTVEAVCAVCGLDEEQALVGLVELVEQSMLQSQEQPDGETRFRMLETIREYGEERLVEQGEAAAPRRRHAAYYRSLAEAAERELTSGPRQKYWHDTLLQEHENIRAALSWSLAGPEAEVGVALAASLWKFWFVYSYIDEGKKWLALALDRSVGWEAPARCTLLYAAGCFRHMQGELAQARVLFEEALALARRLGFPRGIGMALHGLGELMTQWGEYAAARSCFEESLGIFRALEDWEETAWALHNLARGRQAEGDVATASRLLEESAALFRAVEQQRGLLWTLNQLAATLPGQGDEQARAMVSESLAWFRALNDQVGMAWALLILGKMALDQSHIPQAKDHFDEALGLFRKLHDTVGLAIARCRQGHVAFESGQLDEAARCYRESLTLQHDLGFRGEMAEDLEGLAAVAALQGDGRQAARLCGAAEALLLAAGTRRQPAALPRSQRTLALIRAALPAEAFDAAFAEGQTIPFEQFLQDILRFD